ncbi:MAG: ATP-binding protein [Pseudomonadota bacterium]|nr:ATP-binding protein [Pseudomonadota bacterium]
MPKAKMDKVLVRNFLIFVVILVACSGSLMYSMITGDKQLDKTDDLVMESHDIIATSEQLSTLIEGMLAAQRGFLLTGEEEFLEDYELKKGDVSNHLATLNELTDSDPSQQSRLAEIRSYFTDFSKELELRAQTFAPQVDKTFLEDVEIVDSLKNNITRINADILEEQYQILDERFDSLENTKTQYLNTLLISISIGTALLLIFNSFLLRAQRSRNVVEASLKDTEQRFMLAVEGTEDGIFDWDIKNDQIFYSRRFFEMLGYDQKAGNGTIEDAKDLIHPDDVDQVMAYVEQYLNAELSEYRQEFRMKHSSGRWVWVQSRAKGLFDENGNATRLVGAHTDITHMVKTQEKLAAEKEQAESANRAKSEFLAHMSHEIRTPLTAISGIAEILDKRKDNMDDKQQQLIGTLLSSTSSLKDLINDVLDFSKIESGELELEVTDFEPGKLFEEVISMMAVKANEKGISFVFEYEALKNKSFHGDPVRMRQIIVNLISNAIKFTDDGGVKISTEIEERDGKDFLRINVSDTGIGISPENFDLVFEKFKQGDSSVSRKYGGTGLGLPISRNLAKLMGGDIFLSSEAGKGSTFSLIIPYKTTETVIEQDKGKTSKKLDDKIKASLNGESKALLVEDYQGNIVVISYILEDIGITFDVANTGVEALELWQNNHYDVVLMDIQMPEMDGFTATKEIRSLEKRKKLDHTPIIGMTAHALVGDKDKCIEAGMDAYLPKPIVEADLKKEILNQIQQQKKAA